MLREHTSLTFTQKYCHRASKSLAAVESFGRTAPAGAACRDEVSRRKLRSPTALISAVEARTELSITENGSGYRLENSTQKWKRRLLARRPAEEGVTGLIHPQPCSRHRNAKESLIYGNMRSGQTHDRFSPASARGAHCPPSFIASIRGNALRASPLNTDEETCINEGKCQRCNSKATRTASQ
ncbi:unnamed protein product [Pleuronectes platessa]|uniref:Uncharacterized protein n=1 Tax=Pleuronectes platessa TaxID=8262 RepID=A0A9N7YY82_PLEPL|nr:unnamed protein product [Pleuronectes platessa]